MSLVKSEALLLNGAVPDPVLHEKHLSALAESFSAVEMSQLKNVALNTSATHNERYLAVYLIGKRPIEFMPELREIAINSPEILFAPTEPHSLQEIRKNFEVTLRAAALSAIDSTNTVTDQTDFFTSLLKHKNITIQHLARVGLMGAYKHESLISAYVDAKIQGALNDIHN